MEITEETRKIVAKTKEKEDITIGESLKSLIPTFIWLLIFTFVFGILVRYLETRLCFW